MPAKVRVLAGPVRSGKTSALLERYGQALAEQSATGGVGYAVWIAPTQRAADEVRSRLVADGTLRGCFSPGVCTFGQFADAIVAQSDEPYRPLGRLFKRQLIELLLAQANAAGKLEHFGPIAETAGLVDLIAGLISDLKRQGISPERFSDLVERVEPSAKNREMTALYAEYQRLLGGHQLYDAEERFWLARELMSKGRLGPYANVKLAVVDGFTDFTHTQQEILELLARQAPALEELHIALPLEQEAGREELFLKPRQTLEQLQKRHLGLAVQWQPRPSPETWPAMAHLQRRLFCNPREFAAQNNSTTGPVDGPKVEIVAASGQLAEIESLARRIKRLLVLGDEADKQKQVRPHDIAVVFRSVDTSAALVQEVFEEFGIPTAVESHAKLIRSPLLQALVGVVRLAAEDWPYRQLLAVLSNNYFQPKWPEWRLAGPAVATEWAVRQLQVPRGRGELLEALQWRTKADETAADGDSLDDEDAARKKKHRQHYRTALPVLRKLAGALDKVKGTKLLSEWIGVLDGLIKEFGMLPEAQPVLADEAAWKALKSAIAASDQLRQRLKLDPQKLTPQQFVKWLLDVLATEPLPVDSDETGRVRVLSAQSIRALDVPYLFVAGLSEKTFPQPGRDDRIYTDAECRELNKAGLNFADHRQRGSEEMLLFYEVITRATRRLVLSYPALDEKAQPLLASPYLAELERCAPGYIEHKQEISLSPIPQHEQPCSPTEQRVQAASELVAGKPQRLAGLLSNGFAAASANIIVGLKATAARSDAKFGRFDGLLVGEAAKSKLAQRYGPEHCWSVSRLEEYASCPYKFFLNSVLKLEELPELGLEVDFGRRGSLAHEALATLHRRLNSAGAHRSPADEGAAKFNQLSDETFGVLIEKYSSGSPLDQALRKIDLQLLVQWIQGYFGQHEDYDTAVGELDDPLRPAHFEVSFGLKRSADADTEPLSTEKPFDLLCGDETIRFSGRIDRIDIGLVGGEVVFNVLDYKTGYKKKLSQEDLQAGLALQLPIYALAVQELLMIDRRAKPWRVGYWYLKEKGFQADDLPQFFQRGDEGLQETDAWREMRQTLLARVVTLVRSVRGGMFPVFSLDDTCTARCQYHTVCRIGTVRSLDKQWSGPVAANGSAEAKTS